MKTIGCLVALMAGHAGLASAAQSADTIDVALLAIAPMLDGIAEPGEYGPPAARLTTAAGEVRVWVAVHGDYVHVAATIPDTSFAWTDDFVVSLDPLGRTDTLPNAGSRQWYIRRIADSSVVIVAEGEGWFPGGRVPPMLGTTRQGADWNLASTSTDTGWTVELRIPAGVARQGRAQPRMAFRTFNNHPLGWWAWPAPPPGLPPQRVERHPNLWTVTRLP